MDKSMSAGQSFDSNLIAAQVFEEIRTRDNWMQDHAHAKPESDLECVRKPLSHSLALRKQMIALAKWTKAR
jgi:hypothetical protein